MCFSAYPSPFGHVIAALIVGDEIEIKAGFGYPSVEGDSAFEVVIAVSGASALTHTGRRLSCNDGSGVVATNVHYDTEGQYPSPVTDEARAILANAS